MVKQKQDVKSCFCFMKIQLLLCSALITLLCYFIGTLPGTGFFSLQKKAACAIMERINAKNGRKGEQLC